MAKATRPPLNWLALFKESGVAALIALGLSIVMFGLRTVDQQGGLGVQTRWSWVVFAVVSVFIGRLVLAIYRETRQPPHTRYVSIRGRRVDRVGADREVLGQLNKGEVGQPKP